MIRSRNAVIIAIFQCFVELWQAKAIGGNVIVNELEAVLSKFNVLNEDQITWINQHFLNENSTFFDTAEELFDTPFDEIKFNTSIENAKNVILNYANSNFNLSNVKWTNPFPISSYDVFTLKALACVLRNSCSLHLNSIISNYDLEDFPVNCSEFDKLQKTVSRPQQGYSPKELKWFLNFFSHLAWSNQDCSVLEHGIIDLVLKEISTDSRKYTENVLSKKVTCPKELTSAVIRHLQNHSLQQGHHMQCIPRINSRFLKQSQKPVTECFLQCQLERLWDEIPDMHEILSTFIHEFDRSFPCIEAMAQNYTRRMKALCHEEFEIKEMFEKINNREKFKFSFRPHKYYVDRYCQRSFHKYLANKEQKGNENEDRNDTKAGNDRCDEKYTKNGMHIQCLETFGNVATETVREVLHSCKKFEIQILLQEVKSHEN